MNNSIQAIHRCEWVTSDPLYIDYHDNQWGNPVYEDQLLFEMLILEGAQAGLNWLTILRRREGYRQVFNNFAPHTIAQYTDLDLEERLTDSRIIRNRLKVYSVRQNARSFLEIQAQYGTFSQYIWQFVDHTPRINHYKALSEVPTHTIESDSMSKSLKKNGFSFVGTTICYAFMQACGMVNDHTQVCFKYHARKI